MATRLASIQNCYDFLKGGADIKADADKGNRLEIILDGVSVAIQGEIMKRRGYGLLQYTSDGVSGPVEFYGREHYGRSRRNTIRLRRGPVNSVTLVQDVFNNSRVYASTDYTVDPESGILYLQFGCFSDAFRAVQVVYNAGYAETGTDILRALAIPEDLRNATLAQVAYEFSRSEPGANVFGATSVSRPDGSIVYEGGGLLKEVKAVIARYTGEGF